MRPSTRRAIAERALLQLGLITRPQLHELGLSPKAVRGLLARREAVPVGRRTFRIAGSPPSFEQTVLAACLDTGGVASHRTAATLHRLSGFPPGIVDVLTTRRRHRDRHPLATIHSTTNLPEDDLVHIGPIPATSVARTILGLAGLVPVVSAERIRTAIGDAVRDGMASDAWLWWRLEELRCRGRDGVAVMEDILRRRQHLGPTESWLEHRFLDIIEQAGLPLPDVQRRISSQGAFVARVDALYEDQRLVIELEGHQAHSTREQRDRGEARRNRLILAGYQVLVFTYAHVATQPAHVVDTVRRMLLLSDAS